MYRAKLGNSSFAIYEHNIDDEGDQLRLLDELRQAIDAGQLILHYQPQLDLRSGRVLAVEALVRWAHPRLGLIPPVKFLPLAEEAGLMWPLTRWVLEEAISQCAAWRLTGRELSVGVNVSPTTLLEPGFSELVREQLDRYDLPPEGLVLEITETCLISQFERSQRVIEEIRDLGVVVSIDDFGAGVTSLAYLSSLAVGELKLDRSFIMGLSATRPDATWSSSARRSTSVTPWACVSWPRASRTTPRSSCSANSAATSPRGTASAGPSPQVSSPFASSGRPSPTVPAN